MKNKESKTQSNKNTITETIKKSKLNASNQFDFNKLSRRQDGLLNCTIEEEKESLSVTYDIQNLLPFSSIKKEKRELMITALIDAGRLWDIARHYSFSLEPDNLYYDIQGRVYVKTRDVYATEEESAEEIFLDKLKSLVGCTLGKKYKYEDYYNGGLDLLKNDKFLGEIFECDEVDQVVDKLHKEYKRYTSEHKEKFVEISRHKNKSRKISLVILSLVVVASLGLLGYVFLWERPYEQAVIAAHEAYLQSNYNGTVEAMRDVEVERMNNHQKYILAVSCVKCESFSDDNMNNILNAININGDEKIMEYWIYINRLDTESAADIAMQQSSDQLLYYAYLKEKAVVENDTSLTGKEKTERLSEIENKLKPLEEEYSTLTEE